MATIANLTLDELKQMIDNAVAEAVDERLTHLLGEFEISEHDADETDTRTWEEVKDDIERHRWTPPSGTPSVTQLLREDRDS